MQSPWDSRPQRSAPLRRLRVAANRVHSPLRIMNAKTQRDVEKEDRDWSQLRVRRRKKGLRMLPACCSHSRRDVEETSAPNGHFYSCLSAVASNFFPVPVDPCAIRVLRERHNTMSASPLCDSLRSLHLCVKNWVECKTGNAPRLTAVVFAALTRKNPAITWIAGSFERFRQ